MKRWTFLLACSAILCASPVGAQEDDRTWLIGWSERSCGTWLQESNRRDGDMWLLGYGSGMNVKNSRNHLVGSSTDVNGLIGEVELVCQQEPSLAFFAAINRVYWRLDAEGR